MELFTISAILLLFIGTVIILAGQPLNQASSYSILEISEKQTSNIINDVPLANTTLIVATEDNKFNSTNPDIIMRSNVTTKFVVTNEDSSRHNFNIKGLNIDSPRLEEGESYEFTVQTDEPGEYEYYCSRHSNMGGNWIVTPLSADP